MEKLSDNVGKKIVEALKMQSQEVQEEVKIPEQKEEKPQEFQNPYMSVQIPTMSVENAFTQSLNKNLNNDFSTQMQSIEYPANVAILNGLIAKLPVGVSKQTGALIIKQTMEALGLPMSTVLQEAQQVQENLAASARECQKNIIDYRNQIATLEQKAQLYQRQAVAMNDIISLFAKAN